MHVNVVHIDQIAAVAIFVINGGVVLFSIANVVEASVFVAMVTLAMFTRSRFTSRMSAACQPRRDISQVSILGGRGNERRKCAVSDGLIDLTVGFIAGHALTLAHV